MHRLRNDEDHESGCYEALSHGQARDYLFACWSLHVLPYFLVRHFYGVAHGEAFIKWRAEGDPEYAETVSSSYEWKDAVNYLRPEADAALESLNKLANLDSVNSVIIKRLPMRERLDIVCARLGLPTLDAVGYDDEEDLEETVAEEGRLLQEALGIYEYASGSQTSHDGTSMDISMPNRHPRSSSGEVVENAYFRLLRSPEGEEIAQDDYAQYKLFTAANDEAFGKWCSLYRTRLEIPTTRRRSNPRTIASWLLEHVGVLRHLFAFLPYPELEAKQWTSTDLYQWGAVEAFREQSDAIWRIVNDSTMAQEARDFCSSWHSAVSKGPESTRFQLAGDSQRWARLRRMIGPECCREDTTGLDGEGWALIHVLPYVTSTWSTTPMGRSPSGARGIWYHEFPSVRELCHGILDHEDWSAALNFPAGQTWMDQHASDAAGTTVPTCY
ncbi:hypothetical protein PR002_g25393 [Phytophthora rubi]|uniref:Uncharacterized protein n=1 Tax=Phytophthora rubi TaxID=129364 RepID=A0A6A3I799_9STRA|nr:hypothetical protein PR002_g25393 [Phytophthora rubi]